MSDALYQEAIMAHARSPQRAGSLEGPRRRAVVDNPLCGDRVTIDLRIAGEQVADIAQSVRGCALCKASASILAAHAVGCDRATLRQGRDTVEAMLRDDASPPAGAFAEYSVFLPARAARSRHDCILLAFTAAIEAWAAEEEG